jgi:hypothetical protein
VLYRELTRRFGHAATDRQAAYLDADAIESMAESDVVSSGIAQAVQFDAIGYGEAKTRFDEIGEMVSSHSCYVVKPFVTTRRHFLHRSLSGMTKGAILLRRCGRGAEDHQPR